MTTPRENMATWWQKHLDEVERANKTKEAFITEVKENAVTAVNEYIAAKDEEKHNLSPVR